MTENISEHKSQSATNHRLHIRMLCIAFACIWIVSFLTTIIITNKITTMIVRNDYETEIDCLIRQLSDRDNLLDDASIILNSIADDGALDMDDEINDYFRHYEELLFHDDYTVDDDNTLIESSIGLEHMNHVMKPMIYIYPEENMNVDIKLGLPDKITCSYPRYDDGWSVLVDKSGIIRENGREYYGLYWEGEGCVVDKIEEGFCVKGSDTAEFLESTLEKLGLSDVEANEFIVYWLPKLESNPYNVIYFASYEEQDEYMPLGVYPAPETIIRVNMVWQPSEHPVNISEQTLEKKERTGYTVIEWGGTKLE